MKSATLLLYLTLAGLLFAPRLWAQAGSDGFRREEGATLEPQARKQPSIFRRPARPTPAEQLALADALRENGWLGRAARQYRALVHQWHEAPEAVRAQLAYAEILLERGRRQKAFKEFQYLVDNFAGSFPYEEVLRYQFAIANYLMNERVGDWLFFRGFRAPDRALPLFKQIVENAPQWSRTPDAQFLIGFIREEMKDFDQAIAAYETVYRRYPDSDLAAQAAFRRARCLVRISERAPRDVELCQEALSALAACLRDFPGHFDAPAAEEHLARLKTRLVRTYYERARFYDREPHPPRTALLAYRDFVRRFPTSELAERARERIHILERNMETPDDND